MMDYVYQGKKEEIHRLKYIVFKIYELSIRFHNIFLSVNTNSGPSCLRTVQIEITRSETGWGMLKEIVSRD
jgi:hypothetical protein